MGSVALLAATCLGMLLFGYDTGVVSGSVAAIVDALGLTRRQESFVVSSTTLFAGLGCVLAAVASEAYGRRPVAVASAVLYLVGSVCAALADEFGTLAAARCVLGLAVGLASATSTPLSGCSKPRLADQPAAQQAPNLQLPKRSRCHTSRE